MKTYRNLAEFKNDVLQSPDLLNQMKTDPGKLMEEVQQVEPIKDKTVFLTVVGILGLVLISALVIGAIIALGTYKNAETQVEIPDFIVMLGSTAIGALAGLLAPSPGNTE